MSDVMDGMAADVSVPDLSVPDNGAVAPAAPSVEPAVVQPVVAPYRQYVKPEIGEDERFFNYNQIQITGIQLPPAEYQSAAIPELDDVEAYRIMRPQTQEEAVGLVRGAAANSFVLYDGLKPVTYESVRPAGSDPVENGDKPIQFPVSTQIVRSTAIAPPVAKPTSGWDTFKDFFVMENSIASIGSKEATGEMGGYIDPDFDVTAEPAYKDPKYSINRDVLISAPNKEAFDNRVKQLDKEYLAMQNAQGHGGVALLGGMAGALADPALWAAMFATEGLGAGAEILQASRAAKLFEATKALQAAKEAEAVIGTAETLAAVRQAQAAVDALNAVPTGVKVADSFVQGAASEVLPEVTKQSSQYTRTVEQGVFNVAAAGILNAVATAGVLKWKAGERANAESFISDHLSENTGPRLEDADNFEHMTPEEAAAYRAAQETDYTTAGADWDNSVKSMGAAEVNAPTKLDYELAGGKWADIAAMNGNPIARLVKSASLAARKAALWLTDTPYYHAGHAEGKSLGAAGGSVEARIRVAHDRATIDMLQAINNGFDKYRGDASLLARTKTAVTDAARTATGKDAGDVMTYKQYKEAVGDALNGNFVGNSDHPEVVKAADTIREKVYKPILDEMNALQMFGSRTDPETGGTIYNQIDPNSDYAKTYVNRVWDQAEVARNRRILDAAGNLVGGLEHDILRYFQGKQKAALAAAKKLIDPKGKLKSSQDLLAAESNLLSFDRNFRADVNHIRGILKSDINTQDAGQIKTLLKLGYKPKTLLQTIRDGGGLFDVGGELAARDISNKSAVGLVTKRRFTASSNRGGLSEDHLLQYLFEHDFKFGAHSDYNEMNLSDVLDAIAESVHNKTKVWDDEITERLAGAEHDPEYVQHLTESGLDRKSTIADVEKYVREQQGFKTEGDFKAHRKAMREEIDKAAAVRREELAKAKELEAFALHDEETVLEAAQKTVDAIQGIRQGEVMADVVPEGFLPTSTFMRKRQLDMTNAQLGKYVVRDAEQLVRSYLHSSLPSMELTRTFGHDPIENILSSVRDDFNLERQAVQKKMQAAGNTSAEIEAAMLKLSRQETKDLRDVQALADKLMGRYNVPENPDAFWIRASRTVKQYNLLRMLGGMQISALTDLGRPIMVKGFMANARVLKAIGNGTYKLALEEAKKAQVAVEMLLNSRVNMAAGIADDGVVRTGFEKAIEQMSNGFGKLTGMSQHNQMLKGYSGVLIQDEILRAAHALHTGQALTKKQIRDAAKSGLGLDDLKEIADEFNRGTIKNHEGLFVPSYDKFKDYDVVRGMHSAINKSANEIIVTVGKGEMPLWMSHELGSHVMQFKSFLVSSHHKVLIAGLQQGDAAAAEGMLVTLGLGYMVYALKSKISGKEMSDDPATIAMEAASRSGMLSLPFEAIGVTDKLSRGAATRALNLPTQSKFESRNAAGAVLGASVDTLGGMSAILSAATGAEMREGDVKEIRKMLPYQSLWYMNWLFSRVQDAGNELLVE